MYRGSDMKTRLYWIIVFGFALATTAGLVWQRTGVDRLRKEAALRRQEAMRFESSPKQQESLPTTLPETAGEVEALSRANAELARLQAIVRPNAAGSHNREASPTATPARFTAGSVVPADQWRNAGTGTPQATLETVLWAAAGGDIDVFAKSITYMTSADEAAARGLFNALPAKDREQYQNPERLLAALTVPDVGTIQAEVSEWKEIEGLGGEMVIVSGSFSTPERRVANSILPFLRRPDGWKLVVTSPVIARYANQLRLNNQR